MFYTTKQHNTLISVGLLLLFAFAALGLSYHASAQITVLAPAESHPGWDKLLQQAREIDVNTANVTELERLPGVGPSLAARIVAFREIQGPFASPDELLAVRGIGPVTLETIRDYIRTNHKLFEE